jgi:hypothetical protein
MKQIIIVLATMLSLQTFAGNHDPKAIIPLLEDAKISLKDGIAYAEKISGPATSAKFEVEDGKLMISIYTIPEGLTVEPEKATLSELSGDAHDEVSKLGTEVFTDKEHIARASVHMTLFQLSKLTLTQVIDKALEFSPGTVIDVRNPMVRSHSAIADVIIVTADSKVNTVTVDLLSGKMTLVKF